LETNRLAKRAATFHAKKDTEPERCSFKRTT
jgi:hypothetical protein